MAIRTRFAPSPTGYLHIGGARTALFCWLYARRVGGQFVLRIEDTDLERSTPESVQAILESMTWLGLDYDEGPFYQTERFDRYGQVIDALLAEDKAYHCYCSKEELAEMRAAQIARKEKPRYDGRCRNSSAPRDGVPPVVRFRNPDAGEVVVNDSVHGRVIFANEELDDLIIARSDGSPTYNFTVVVDDMDMQITHVIRGDDHLNNTPRQINILAALGADIPHYAHVPMILGADGARLSKRHGAVSVLEYRDQGYLPEAMINYLVRLGWSHGDQEIFSRADLTEIFDLDDVNKSASTFNPEKLAWLNQHYMKSLPPEELVAPFRWQLAQLGIDNVETPNSEGVILAQRERNKTLAEMASASEFFYSDFDEFEPKAAKKHLRPVALELLVAARARLADIDVWESAAIHEAITAVAEAHQLKLGKVAQPIRVAVSGTSISPPIDETLALLGRERALARIDRAVEYIRQRAAPESGSVSC